MDYFSTYKVYKQGTYKVVAWLGKTAAHFGYNTLTGTSNQEKAKKKLGFADIANREKQAKKKSALADTTNQQRTAKKVTCKSNGDSSATCQVTNKYTVAELSVLARFISKQSQQTWKKKSKTLNILTVLEDVIVKRKEWAKAFMLPDASTLASNERHEHFIIVLKEVYEILRGAIGTSQQQGKWEQNSKVVALREAKSTSMEEDTALCNLFAVLDIEELPTYQEESADLEEGIAPKSSRPPATTTYELEEDEIDDDEVHFMIYCFFKDFQNIRKHISRSWADYKSGELDLVAVSVTTNVALEMLQRAETELLESLPRKCNLNTYERVAALLMTEVAPTLCVDPESFLQSGEILENEAKLKGVMDFTCWPVYIILSSFSIPQGEGEHLHVLKPGKFGEIDLTGQPLSWREKLNQDKIVLYELLPELCILKDMRLSIPYLDELSAGLMEMIQTEIVPISVVLSCQIYLDIHQGMLSKINMAQMELQTMGRHFSTTLQEYLDFSKTVSYDTWKFVRKEMEKLKEERDKASRKFKLEADLWVNQDILAASRRHGLKKLNLLEDSTVRPYSLLSRHPMLCGILLFRMNLILEEGGIALADTFFPSLVHVIHLYNAVKNESEDGFPVWGDLEAIMEMSGESRLFNGDYPKNASEYLKRWMQLQGADASTFAQNHRLKRRTDSDFARSNMVYSKRDHRTTIKLSYTALVFRCQYMYHEKKTRSDKTFHNAELILSTISGNKQRPGPFTSLSFLESLQYQIQSDVPALNINYYALHHRCTGLLRDIFVKLEPRLDFDPHIGTEFMIGDIGLERLVVGRLFQMAADTEYMATRFVKRVRRGAVVRSKELMEAGELVKKLAQKEGDRELERVRSICRGYDFDCWENGGPEWWGNGGPDKRMR